MDLTQLKTDAAAAAAAARQLVADVQQGRSQFAAAIRSALDHANELIAQQEQWLAANPPAPSAIINPPAAN